MTSFLGPRLAGLVSVSTVLRLIAVGGLVIDARVHLKLAVAYDSIRSSTVSQGDLFRFEGGLAIAAALLVLLVPKRVVALFAGAVAGGGLAALLFYRYVDAGAIGPLPPMYEPAWYPDKVDTCIAQAVATAACLCLFVAQTVRLRKGRRAA